MLTRLFGQSKPINFLLVAIYMAIFYSVANAATIFSASNVGSVLEEIALLLLYVLSMVLLNFIAKKNDLNKLNTYKIVIYASFTALFFELLRDDMVIAANIFVILALRRMVSLRNNKTIKKKIFDAAFWICIASLFQFWAILIFITLYFAILFHSNRSWKNFAIPTTAFVCVFIFATSYMLLKTDSFFKFIDWYQPTSFDFSSLNNLQILIPLSLILGMVLWVTVSYIKATTKASISQKPSMYLILITLVVCMVLALFSPTKDGSELLFLFAPLSVMTAKYFEREEEFWFKEFLLWVLLLLPIAVPIFF